MKCYQVLQVKYFITMMYHLSSRSLIPIWLFPACYIADANSSFHNNEGLLIIQCPKIIIFTMIVIIIIYREIKTIWKSKRLNRHIVLLSNKTGCLRKGNREQRIDKFSLKKHLKKHSQMIWNNNNNNGMWMEMRQHWNVTILRQAEWVYHN
jgi:hypothetical protein